MKCYGCDRDLQEKLLYAVTPLWRRMFLAVRWFYWYGFRQKYTVPSDARFCARCRLSLALIVIVTLLVLFAVGVAIAPDII